MMRNAWIKACALMVPALGALALLPRAATARPADCLVVMEGRSYIDGRCDFAAEAGGDFTVTLGTRSAKVMVDPGARAGRAFYEDASPATPESWVIGDVRRDGACWANRVGHVCAWEPGQRPARRSEAPGAVLAQAKPGGAAPPAPTGNSVLRQWDRRIGDWIVARYQDAGDGRLVRCELERTYPDSSVLRIEAAPGRPLAIGFATAGTSLDRLGARFEVRYWVDDENGTQIATATAIPPRSARFVEEGTDTGSLEGLAAGRGFSIIAGELSLQFSLRGSSAAIRALGDCARS